MTLEPGAELVLRALRLAPLRLSVEQIAGETGLTNEGVEVHLVSLQTAGLARIWTRDSKRGGRFAAPLTCGRRRRPTRCRQPARAAAAA